MVMVCPFCGFATDVVNSRPQKRLNQIWRRRHCIRCTNTFTTTEAADLAQVLFVYSTKKEAPSGSFQRDKLFLSLYSSLGHRKTALADATALTATVASKLYPSPNNPVIETKEIIEASIKALKRFDKVAATHYQAYHPL